MQTDNGRNQSLWMKTADVPGGARISPKMRPAMSASPGGGIAGLSVAYFLHQGRQENHPPSTTAQPPAAKASRTSAHLTYYNDDTAWSKSKNSTAPPA